MKIHCKFSTWFFLCPAKWRLCLTQISHVHAHFRMAHCVWQKKNPESRREWTFEQICSILCVSYGPNRGGHTQVLFCHTFMTLIFQVNNECNRTKWTHLDWTLTTEFVFAWCITQWTWNPCSEKFIANLLFLYFHNWLETKPGECKHTFQSAWDKAGRALMHFLGFLWEFFWIV